MKPKLVLYKHSLLRVLNRQGTFFCECEGTGFENWKAIDAYDSAVELAIDALQEDGYSPGMRSGGRPRPLQCDMISFHNCATCNADLANQGIELEILVEQIGHPAYTLIRCFCMESCLEADYGRHKAAQIMQFARTIRKPEDEL